MKFRFALEILETGEIKQFKTLKDMSEYLDIPYHQTKSIMISEDKIFLHPHIKILANKYKITKNT